MDDSKDEVSELIDQILKGAGANTIIIKIVPEKKTQKPQSTLYKRPPLYFPKETLEHHREYLKEQSS